MTQQRTFGAITKSWLRRAGAALGLLLLAAAVVMAWRQRDVVAGALEAMQDMPPARRFVLLAVLFATVIGNLALTGLLFFTLVSRYGRVGVLEMQAVMASATLLNFLPLRPGLFGRVAYHRIYNEISVLDSTKVVMHSAVISVLCAGYLALAIVLHRFVLAATAPLWVIAIVPLALAPVAASVRCSFRRLAIATGLRYLEVLVMAIRYWAAFALIGSPIESSGALAFAAVSMITMMTPLLSNGLGLREWAVGLTAPLLTAYHMTLGITADLVNRAAELCVIVPAGMIASAALARWRGIGPLPPRNQPTA